MAIGNAEPARRDGASRLTLLGRPALVHAGRVIPLPERAYCLAAVLASTDEHRAPRSRIREILWGGADPEKASNNLRQLLSRIVRVQREYDVEAFVVDGVEVLLDRRAVSVDLLDWQEANVDLLSYRHEWDRLASVLERFANPLLDGVAVDDRELEDWILLSREALQAAWMNAAVRLLDQGVGSAPGESLMRIAFKAIALDPCCEAAYRGRMRIHASAGNLVAVRQIYRECCDALRKEVDAAPAPETIQLAQALLGPAEPARPTDTPRAAEEANGLRRDNLKPRVAVLLLPGLDAGPLRSVRAALLEDIIVGLSRYRSFRTIAAHTSLNPDRLPKGGLGAVCDYSVFTGLVDWDGGLKAIFRLTRALDDEVLWAEDFAVLRHGAAAFFRGVTSRVLASVADAVERSELEFPVAPEDAGAYRMYLEGRQHLRSTDLRDLRRARRWFRRAASADPTYTGGLVGVARSLTMEWLVRGAPEEDLLASARLAASDAIRIDPRDARGYRELGFTALYAKNYDESLRRFAEALDLNPNEADLIMDQADALSHSGDPEAGLAAADAALDLNPVPPSYYHWIRGSIYYQLERFDDALQALEPVKGDPATARLMAATAAMAGDRAQARLYAGQVRATYPEFTTESLWRIVPNRNPRDTERLIEGLRAAGLK